MKIKLNQIVKMGYKSTYKSEQIQTRLKQGYYDDIVEAGIQGGVFDADTQPAKGELDLQLAKVGAGLGSCRLTSIRINGIDSLSTKEDYEAFYQSVYEQLLDIRSTQKEVFDCDEIQAVAVMNGFPLNEIPFVIEKAEVNGSFHDSEALPVIQLRIHPLKNPDSYYCESFVRLRMGDLSNKGDTYADELIVVEMGSSDGKIIYPEIVGYNWSNDGGDSSLTGKDVSIEQVIQKLTEKRQEIADLLEQNEVGLVYVKYGSSDLGTEERPEVYFKVEKTYSRSYTMTGYILRMTVMSPKFENDLEPSVAYIFEDGTYHIWKKEDGVTYPHLGTYNSNNGGEKDLDELKATFETLTKTLFNKIPENGTGIFDLSVGGIGTLIIKAENVIRQIGTSWERGMYYTIMGGTGGYSLDFENYMGLVWVGVGGGTGGNANAVIWKKNSKMIYPQIASFNWGSLGGDGTLLGNWTIDEFASKLSEQYTTILEALSYTQGGVGLVDVSWGEPLDNYSTYVKVELSHSYTYMNSRRALVATPLVGPNISTLACKIYISSKNNYIVLKKENSAYPKYPIINAIPSSIVHGFKGYLTELAKDYTSQDLNEMMKRYGTDAAILRIEVDGSGTPGSKGYREALVERAYGDTSGDDALPTDQADDTRGYDFSNSEGGLCIMKITPLYDTTGEGFFGYAIFSGNKMSFVELGANPDISYYDISFILDDNGNYIESDLSDDKYQELKQAVTSGKILVLRRHNTSGYKTTEVWLGKFLLGTSSEECIQLYSPEQTSNDPNSSRESDGRDETIYGSIYREVICTYGGNGLSHYINIKRVYQESGNTVQSISYYLNNLAHQYQYSSKYPIINIMARSGQTSTDYKAYFEDIFNNRDIIEQSLGQFDFGFIVVSPRIDSIGTITYTVHVTKTISSTAQGTVLKIQAMENPENILVINGESAKVYSLKYSVDDIS